jgi:hypothetical protein
MGIYDDWVERNSEEAAKQVVNVEWVLKELDKYAVPANASQSTNGLMSAADKLRLDNINLYKAFYTGDGNITTAQFLKALYDNGAFNTPQWTLRTTWSYNNNPTITDTGVGNIEIAGALIEVFTTVKPATSPPIDATTGSYKIRITTAPASSPNTNYNAKVFLYVNNGTTYSPTWRRLVDSTEEMSGTTLGLVRLNGDYTFTGVINVLTPETPS